MKILIAIPCLDQMDTSFVRCLMALRMPGECSVSFIQSSLIYDARNQACKQAIENGFDYILWLDSDMVFGADLLERMLDSIGDEELLTALCFRRNPPYYPCIYEFADYVKQEGGLYKPITKQFSAIPQQKTKISACGFACVLMKTTIIKKLILKGNTLPFSPLIGFGEDLSFCYNARTVGAELWCDPSISIGHLAQVTITRDAFEAMKDEKNA